MISTTVTTWRTCDLVCWSNFSRRSHQDIWQTDWQICCYLYV